MVKDTKTGEVLRADHLVKAVLEAHKPKKEAKTIAVKLPDEVVSQYETILAQLDNYSGPELGQLCQQHKITNPDTGNEVGEPQQFNLMFASSIGPTGQHPGYSHFSLLAPRNCARSLPQFISRLLEFNYNRVPFASAQIGRSFRNEISPRAGLLHVQEFTMAEIEHFVDLLDKRHKKFSQIRDVEIRILPRDTQSAGKTELTTITVGQAVDKGIIANETLSYFVARIYQFLLKIAIHTCRLRFRQHMANEMAHYATDCGEGVRGGVQAAVPPPLNLLTLLDPPLMAPVSAIRGMLLKRQKNPSAFGVQNRIGQDVKTLLAQLSSFENIAGMAFNNICRWRWKIDMLVLQGAKKKRVEDDGNVIQRRSGEEERDYVPIPEVEITSV
ncbi:hypothetical protein JB92DRAFT_3126223 [Gautieria morchelliformis]|nr:hypothetical protein JB92DRAFT_3126223 [Gautieria morchelliformis]